MLSIFPFYCFNTNMIVKERVMGQGTEEDEVLGDEVPRDEVPGDEVLEEDDDGHNAGHISLIALMLILYKNRSWGKELRRMRCRGMTTGEETI
jgi:hypothetical protein